MTWSSLTLAVPTLAMLSLAAGPAAAEADAAADARAAMHLALEEQATMPSPPELPDHASPRAVDAHRDTAFGKKGAEERAAHAKAAGDSARDADDVRAGVANRAAGAGTGQGADGDTHSAAEMMRARGNGVGGGKRKGPKGMASPPAGAAEDPR